MRTKLLLLSTMFSLLSLRVNASVKVDIGGETITIKEDGCFRIDNNIIVACVKSGFLVTADNSRLARVLPDSSVFSVVSTGDFVTVSGDVYKDGVVFLGRLSESGYFYDMDGNTILIFRGYTRSATVYVKAFIFFMFFSSK